jgi:hypothetical protein
MPTVMMRVSIDAKKTLEALLQPGETLDAVLRRLLGMEPPPDEDKLGRSIIEWPFVALKTGEHVIIPWPLDVNTRLSDPKRVERIRRAIRRDMKRTGRLYHTTGTSMGLRIERMR